MVKTPRDNDVLQPGRAVRIATLGCKVNQADSEALAEALVRRGYRIAGPDEPAAVCVVNTCTVTHVADAKARKLIRRLARDNPGAEVVVTGCGAERAAAAARIATAVRVVTNSAKHELPQVVAALLSKKALDTVIPSASEESPTSSAPPIGDSSVAELPRNDTRFCRCGERTHIRDAGPRPARPGSVRAFVKVQDGCDHRCAYCIVPDARGPRRSRPLQEVVAHVRSLAQAGAREVVICGIRLGTYGEEPLGRGLARLLRAAREVPVARLRLSSIEPWDVGEELIEEVAAHPLLCPHLHLPLQSGDDEVLRAMGRPYSLHDYGALVERLRKLMPDIAVTTDLMVGFPGESERAFDNTCHAVATLGFARVHVFRYSPRPGTPAAAMPEHVPERVKTERAGVLTKAAAQAARRFAQRLTGRVVPVLFEQWEAGTCCGLTDTYLTARAPGSESLAGQVAGVRIRSVESEFVAGEVVD
jgi:threonylcarbamoyladenosine tRNA methylthiotransferase MtaB